MLIVTCLYVTVIGVVQMAALSRTMPQFDFLRKNH